MEEMELHFLYLGRGARTNFRARNNWYKPVPKSVLITIAKTMKVMPTGYYNKSIISGAIARGIFVYLDSHPNLKERLKRTLVNDENHYLYDFLYNEN